MNCNTDKNVTELKERIQVLEKELDNANELLSSSKLRGLSFDLATDAHLTTFIFLKCIKISKQIKEMWKKSRSCWFYVNADRGTNDKPVSHCACCVQDKAWHEADRGTINKSFL